MARALDLHSRGHRFESDILHKINRMIKNCKCGDVKPNDDRVPEYYKGLNGYEARKVCDNFDLSYHLATAITYIIRAYKKHKTPIECLNKAIAHIEFEIEKYEQNNK